MYACSVSVVAILLAGVDHGTSMMRSTTDTNEAQVGLSDGVLQPRLWHDLWFDSVTDEEDWMRVSRVLDPQSGLETGEKLAKIPLMMGCDHGLRLNWFLLTAVHVIGECNYLAGYRDRQTGDCWTRLKRGLEAGSLAMLKVMRTLTHVHNIVGDDIGFDEFYQSLVPVRNFLTARPAVEFSGASQEGFDFGRLLNEATGFLHRFLVSNCRPAYKPFDLEELMNEHELRDPASYSYRFFLNKIDHHVRYVNDRLVQLGFHYNADLDETVFEPNG